MDRLQKLMSKKWIDERYTQTHYKTKPCRNQYCKKDFTCPYYHSWVDRRRAVENYKTKGCRHAWQESAWSDPTSLCQDGDECEYAHSRMEMQFHSKKYKTQLCREFLKGKNRCCRSIFCAFKHGPEDFLHSANADKATNPVTKSIPVSKKSNSRGRAIRGTQTVFGSQSYARIASFGVYSSNSDRPTSSVKQPIQMEPELEDLSSLGAWGPIPDNNRNEIKGSSPTRLELPDSPVQEVSFTEDELDEEEVYRNSRSPSILSDAGELVMNSFSKFSMTDPSMAEKSERVTSRRLFTSFPKQDPEPELPENLRQSPETVLWNLRRKADIENDIKRRASLSIPLSHLIRRNSGKATLPVNHNVESSTLSSSLFGPYSHVLVLAEDDPIYKPPIPLPPSDIPLPQLERKSSMLPLWMGLTGSQLEAWAAGNNEASEKETEHPALPETGNTGNAPAANGSATRSNKFSSGPTNGGIPLRNQEAISERHQYMQDPLYRTGIWVDTNGMYTRRVPAQNVVRNPSNGHYNNGL